MRFSAIAPSLCLLLISELPAALPPAREMSGTADIRQVLDGRMLPDVEVRTFKHSDRLYPSALVRRGKQTTPLPSDYNETLHQMAIHSNGHDFTLDDYLTDDRVAGLLILKGDRLVLEDYKLGLTPGTRWASWSMAKSISSTLIGAALQQGLIGSLDDPVSRYVPALRGSAYDHVSIRNVLRMSSGIGWNETYTDPNSDCRKLTEQQLRHKPGASMAYMAGLRSVAPQGTVWNYNSGEANIPGAILEAVTHKPLAQYLSETLWQPLGMESDATWWTESPGGLGLSGVGIGATLRDYARFGLFVEHGGIIGGRRIVPPGWFQQSTVPQQIGGKLVNYGLLWWPMPAGDPIDNGSFQAIGIFGQHLYISPAQRLVIVVLSARPKPVSVSPVKDIDVFTAVAHRLAQP